MNRETMLARTFVDLAATLVREFDTIDLLHMLTERSASLLDADAASLILADQRGELQVLASTSPQAQMLDVFQVHTSEGPCYDCYVSGRPLVNVDLAEAGERWPSFHRVTTDAGYRSTHSLPLRLHDQVIGALNFFCIHESELGDDDVELAQALSDVATVGLLQERMTRRHELLSEQLQSALNSRVLMEQAKGMLSERATIDVEEAFALMREHSKRTERSLAHVANDVIDGSIEAADLTVTQ